MVKCFVGVFGVGLIGSALKKQLAQQTSYLHQIIGADVSVVAISNSRNMLLSEAPLQLSAEDWSAALAAGGVPADPDALAQHVAAQRDKAAAGAAGAAAAGGAAAAAAPPVGVTIDCTASDQLADHYAAFVQRHGLHIITPNKKLGAGPLGRYDALRAAARDAGVRFMCEATVGAGLPVVSTLQALLDTGDEVLSIEGVLSGTLSYIFNSWQPPRQPFSAVVAEARRRGYTEPDARDDLSGADVARKVVILARACGVRATLGGLDVASLVPKPLRAEHGAGADDFLARLPEFDSDMARQAAEAAAAGEVLRYVGRVDVERKTASVRTARFPKTHPFAQLAGSDNLVAFRTRRYDATPLVVRGPGAGADVTAAGVFSDLLQVLRAAGAKG